MEKVIIIILNCNLNNNTSLGVCLVQISAISTIFVGHSLSNGFSKWAEFQINFCMTFVALGQYFSPKVSVFLQRCITTYLLVFRSTSQRSYWNRMDSIGSYVWTVPDRLGVVRTDIVQGRGDCAWGVLESLASERPKVLPTSGYHTRQNQGRVNT
jgi:hypothetical protein